ncbi:MAG: TylF/MycF/NovP-related O-methyltransferase, partial [Betaproteobacteria bacterium]
LDTFAGMPGNSENNVTFSEGTFVSSLPKVRDKCLSAGMETSFFSLYCGLFSDTKTSLIEHLSPKIAIVNIDCDLKSSTVDALAAIRDRLQVGCVLMFDDFNAFCADNSQGERRAFRDFCNDVRFKFEPWFSYHYAGQAFLCVED